MIELSTALTGLRAAQTGLQTATNNITNAGTEGYTRQVVDLANRLPIDLYGVMVGTGVEVVQVRRLLNESIQSSIIANAGSMSSIAAQSDAARQFELLLASENGGVGQRLDELRDGINELSKNAQTSAHRGIVVNQSRRLAESISTAAQQLQRARASSVAVMQATVKSINQTVGELTRVNEDIRRAEALKMTPNDLLDRRDALLTQLGEMIDTNVYYSSSRRDVPKSALPAVLVGNGEYQLGTKAPVFSLAQSEDGTLGISVNGGSVALNPEDGKLGGLLRVYNEQIPAFTAQLDQLARSIVHAVDSVHATAIPTTNGFERLFGARGLTSTTEPLNQSAVPGFELQSGRVYVGVRDAATGNRTLQYIDVDVTTDSLTDIAAKISALSHLDAVIDTSKNRLSVLADAGYGFDFTGRPSTVPDTSGWTGSTVARMTGAYNGSDNLDVTLRVSGTGIVGITDDLKVQVLDADGNLLNTLQIGGSYSAGSSPQSELEVVKGVFVSFTAGTVNDGESFNTSLIGQPDETGLLVALGLNSLFEGTDAAGLAVRTDILRDPQLLSTSVTGEPGNALRLSQLLQAFDGGPDNTQSLLSLSTELAGGAANLVADLQAMSENASFVDQTLRAERDSLSGVDTDEEFVKILQFQRAYQAASRIILISDEMIQELLSMVR